MNKQLLSTYTKHAAATLDKQIHLNSLVSDLDFVYNKQPSELAFGDECRWSAQVLGSESEESKTWLWAWANGASGFTDESLVGVRKLQKLGKSKGIVELVTPEIPFDEFDGNFWSVIASGLIDADAYFRAPYPGGALYLVIQDATFERSEERTLARLATVFPQAIAAFPMENHARALASYASYLDLNHEITGRKLLVSDKHGGQLEAQFDQRNRLEKLKG